MTIKLVAARGVAPYPGTLHFPGMRCAPEPASVDGLPDPRSQPGQEGLTRSLAASAPPSDIGIVWVGGLNALASVNDKYMYSGELRFPFPVDTRACPTLADWKSGCESARARAVPVRFPVPQREVDHVRDPDGRGGERNGRRTRPGRPLQAVPPGSVPSGRVNGRCGRREDLSVATGAELPPARRSRVAAASRFLGVRRELGTSLVSVAGLVGRPVRGRGGELVGRLADVVVRSEAGYPAVAGFVVRIGPRRAWVHARDVAGVEQGQLRLLSSRFDLQDVLRRPGEIQLVLDVIDQQLVDMDMDGVRVVRAADLYLASPGEIWRLVGVDVSLVSFLRRALPGRPGRQPSPAKVLVGRGAAVRDHRRSGTAEPAQFRGAPATAGGDGRPAGGPGPFRAAGVAGRVGH